MTTVGMYVRISEDTRLTGLGVARQRQDCEALAERKSWTVTQVYEDNDVSATSGKRRPEYQRMLDDVRAGTISGVIVWDIDRLTRTPSELEEFIVLADRHDLSLASVGGEIDLATPQGRLTARIKGSVARHEVEQASRRIRRKNLERAEAGLSHGPVAWGWVRAADGSEQLDPAKGRLIREAADRMLAGDTLTTIARDWSSRGLVAPSGKPWTRHSVRDMLDRPRNAGLRQYQGEIIGEGAWPAVLDLETWDRVKAVLGQGSRYDKPGPRVETLLAGIACCGICRAEMYSSLRGREGKKVRTLMCKGCGGTLRKQVDVETFVEAALLARLAESNPDELFARKGSDPELLRRELHGLRERKNQAALMFASGDIDGGQLRAINEKLAAPLAKAEAAYEEALAEPDLMDLAGEGILERWDGLSWERKRRALDYLMAVTIHPTKHTGHYRRFFDPTTIEMEWKV